MITIVCKVKEQKKVNNESDVGYKSFLEEKWVKLLDKEDLELVNKSFILTEYKGKESDLIYKVKLKEKEIYFYILLELQSAVDFTML